MIRRRDMLVGGLCAGTMGAAALAVPRQQLALYRDVDLNKTIPEKFGRWETAPVPGNVLPDDEDSLAAQLYSQIVSRVYVSNEGDPVMMVIAYGDTQSDTLQLHRPEVCYVAAGFDVSVPHAVDLDFAGRTISGVGMTAVAPYRYEHILYWTRVGNELPRNRWDQQMSKFRAGIRGVIPDGTLVRFSTLTEPGRPTPPSLSAFIRELLGELAPMTRAALIGKS